MVVRELVALLGVKSDKASFKQAETGMSKLVGWAKTLGLAFAGMKLVSWVKGFINNASAVNETLNVLDASFGESQDEVMTWAETFGKAAGRSQFAMREMAGVLGAVLNPLLDKNAEAAAGMSMEFAALAVDLASFYNTAEEDALGALRGGITGEAERLKRFGIVMNDVTMEAFALREGLDSDIQGMTIAEKTMLRYKFIMDQTVNAQGDAVKTSQGFANASKRMAALLKDAGIKIGLMLLPILEKMLPVMGDLLDGSSGLIEVFGRILRVGFKVVEWGLRMIRWTGKFISTLDPFRKKLLLVGTAVAVVGKLLMMGPFGKFLLLFGLIVLAIDDFIVFMEGGESVIGRVNEKLKELFDLDLKEAIEGVNLFFSNLAEHEGDTSEIWNDLWFEMGEVVKNHLSAAGETWSNFFGDLSSSAGKWFDELIESLYQKLVGWLADSDSTIINGWFDIYTKLNEQLSAWFDGMLDGLYQKVASWIEKIKNFNLTDTIFDFFKGDKKGPSKPGGGTVTAPIGTRAGGAPTVIDNKTNVTVEVKAAPGMSEEKLAQNIGRHVKKVVDKQNRAAMQALTPSASGLPI